MWLKFLCSKSNRNGLLVNIFGPFVVFFFTNWCKLVSTSFYVPGKPGDWQMF